MTSTELGETETPLLEGTNKVVCASGPRGSSNTRGQTAEARKTTILQPVDQKPHSQKDRQDEKAEGYIPDEGTR